MHELKKNYLDVDYYTNWRHKQIFAFIIAIENQSLNSFLLVLL